MRSIRHFMWGYQDSFRVSLEHFAEVVLQTLDPEFEPQVFLVGINIDSNPTDSFTACVEPERDFWVSSDYFDDAASLASQLSKEFPEAKLEHSHPAGAQLAKSRLCSKGLRNAILQLTDEHPDRPADLRFFVSYPVVVGRYQVAVVLGIQEPVCERYAALNRRKAWIHEYRYFEIARSLIEATILQLLRLAEEELRKSEAGADLAFASLEPNEVVRGAGRELCRGIIRGIDIDLNQGSHGFFKACNEISALRYEGGAGSGHLLLAPLDHDGVRTVLSFQRDTSLFRYREARKLTELCGDGLMLHTDSELLAGLVKMENYDISRENAFQVEFLGHYHWHLRHGDSVLMSVLYGTPSLYRLPFNEGKLKSDLARIFKNEPDLDANGLVELVRTAETEKHGTLLVISAKASDESQRLSGQGTPIEPTKMTSKLLSRLTSIDGAIMLGVDGTCHAIGTILDGVACSSGDPARGARYNSAIRYVEHAGSCLAVVVSEDGGVDFIPNLPPAISRNLISDAISTLQKLKKEDKINRNEFRQTVDKITTYRQYLCQSDCEKINPLLSELEEKLSQQESSDLRIIHPTFQEPANFDEAMLYIEE